MKAAVVVFLAAGLSGVLGFVIPTGDELAKLASAEKTWQKLSAGSKGYLVHHQGSGLAKTLPALLHSAQSKVKGSHLPVPSNLEKFPTIIEDLPKDEANVHPAFVDKASGAVQKVCDHAVPTVPPTKPPTTSLPVVVIHRVEEMFRRLVAVLKGQLCKVVKIVYSENKAYPVIARLAGCKSPAVDAILDLGAVVLAPKSHAANKDTLCKFAKAHTHELNAASKKALATFLPYIRVGTVKSVKAVDPKPVVPKQQPHVNPEHLQAALKDVKSAIAKIAPTQTPQESLKKLKGTLKTVVDRHFTSKTSSRAIFYILPSLFNHLQEHPMPKVWPVPIRAVDPRLRSAPHLPKQAKVTPEHLQKTLDDMKSLLKKVSQTQQPSVSLEKLHSVMDKAVVKHFQAEGHTEAMSALKSSVLMYLRAHPMLISGEEDEHRRPEPMDFIPARLPDEGGYGANIDNVDSQEDDDAEHRNGDAARDHAHRHHRHHAHGRKVKMILFYTSAGILGVAILFTLYRSVRECRKSRPRVVQVSKTDGRVDYGKLIEEDCVVESKDLPPVYSQAHCIASPTQV